MFSVSIVRLLKGVPLACWVALIIANENGLGPQGAEWLERATGYTDKPVGQALLFLEENGVISRNGRYLWQLCGEFAQLPLGRDALPRSAKGVGETPTHPSSSSSRYIDSKLSDSTTTSQTLSAEESENLRLDEGQVLNLPVLAALDAAKIREPARGQLARLDWISVELIEYHVRTADKIGQAIYRIKNKWPICDKPDCGYAQDVEERKKYVGGAFSDFIQH